MLQLLSGPVCLTDIRQRSHWTLILSYILVFRIIVYFRKLVVVLVVVVGLIGGVGDRDNSNMWWCYCLDCLTDDIGKVLAGLSYCRIALYTSISYCRIF